MDKKDEENLERVVESYRENNNGANPVVQGPTLMGDYYVDGHRVHTTILGRLMVDGEFVGPYSDGIKNQLGKK